ncbi:MAG: hypothetical protein KA163_09250 [Bacteroidia bacterium]|nr:hypothetical protein [Bacteroidia bacterium]
MKSIIIPHMPVIKNRLANVIFVSLLVFLLLPNNNLAQPCAVRNHPFEKNKNLTRITTCFPLEFGVFVPVKETAIEDTIFLGISADSLKEGPLNFVIYVYFPKETKIDSSYLEIGFENGGIERFQPIYEFKSENYVEYAITQKQYLKLKNYSAEYINFHLDNNDLEYFDNYSPYFSIFFAAL